MKTNPDSDAEDPLLEAVLRDDDWLPANTAGKAQALGVFRARQRARRRSRWAGGLAALAVLAACAAHWRTGRSAPVPPRLAEKPIYLTDSQLLALFPAESCFLAEVDGKKKLVFFDPKVEREYISYAGGQPSSAP